MMQKGLRRKNNFSNKKKLNKKSPPFFITKYLFIILIFFLLIGGIVGTVYGVKKWMKCCPYFFISTIEITGNNRLSEREILKLSNIEEGANIFAINLKKIQENILENPWIKDVSVERILPDIIHINITERVPIGLARINQKIYLIDKDGTPFKLLTPKDSFSAPIITGIELNNLASKDSKNLIALIDTDKMADAIKIIKMSKKGVRALGFNNISQIDFPNDETVVIYTADKAIPFYLNRKRLVKQFLRAEKILIQLYNSGQYQKVLSVNVGYGQDMALAKIKK